MKRFKSLTLSVFAFFVAAAFVLAPQPTSAQSSASLSIVPKKTYTIESGKSVNDVLTIRNLDADRTLELTLRVVDFTYNDDGGAPKLFLDEDAPQTSWSLKPYLSVPERVSIPPKTSRTLDMSVSIPQNVGAGSLYSAILYSSSAPDSGGNVGLSASGVTLVFTSIPGEVNEKLALEDFGAYRLPTASREGGYEWFATDEPQYLAYTLRNEGNVTASPVGSINLRHMFGAERVIQNVNPNDSLALIGQTRTFTACIKLASEDVELEGQRSRSSACTSPGLWPGIYTAQLNVFYGQNGNRTQEIAGTAFFIYMPWWFTIILIVVLAAIGFGIWKLVRKIRRRQQRTRLKKSSRR